MFLWQKKNVRNVYIDNIYKLYQKEYKDGGVFLQTKFTHTINENTQNCYIRLKKNKKELWC